MKNQDRMKQMNDSANQKEGNSDLENKFDGLSGLPLVGNIE